MMFRELHKAKLRRLASKAFWTLTTAAAAVPLLPKLAEAAGQCQDTWGLIYYLCEAAHHSPVFAVGGMGAAVAATALSDDLVDEEEREETEESRTEKEPKDPCAEQKARWEASSAKAKMLQKSLETLRGAHKQVSEEWERNRQEGYWDASWTLATFVGGWATRGAAGAVVAGSVVKALAKKMAQNIAKSMTGAAFRNLLRKMSDANMTWEDLITEPAKGASDPVPNFLAMAQQSMVNDVSDNLQGFGFEVGSEEYSEAMGVAGNTYITPYFNFLDDMVNVYKLGSGIWSSAERSDKLLKMRSKLQSAISRVEWEFDEAVFELKLDRESYNDCLDFHAD